MAVKDVLSSFVKQYYFDKMEFPSKIMLPQEIEDTEIITEILSEKANKKIEIKIPKKGEKLRFIEMANQNAKITLENRTKEKEDILNLLKEALRLNALPRKIECFDISNLARRLHGRWNGSGTRWGD